MKKITLILSVILLSCVNYCQSGNQAPFSTHYHTVQFIHQLRNTTDADWLVVGAGPAGIASVGVLMDVGIAPSRITWIDPEFNVGRLGPYFNYVPANNKTKEFIEFVNACATFQSCCAPALNALRETDPNKYDNLKIIIDPLREITGYLRTQVNALQDRMTGLSFHADSWHVTTHSNKKISANYVILATGSQPRALDYEKQKVIPLDIALNPHNLEKLIYPEDIVGVLGSSHSAILLLKFLSELNVNHVYNFYKHPLIYAIDMGDWVMNAFNGLKGETAQWAQTILEKNPPANLTRIKSTKENLKKLLPDCTKIIYAIGFEKNPIPNLENITGNLRDDAGMIAPRLFGIGIAFPEKATDKVGNEGYCVGLDCFMEYAHAMIPEWLENETYKEMKKQKISAQMKKLKKLSSDLFRINLL